MLAMTTSCPPLRSALTSSSSYIASIPSGRDADTAQSSHPCTHEDENWFHTKAQSAAPGRDKGDGECNDDKEYNGVWLERGSCLCCENICAATACGKHREMVPEKNIQLYLWTLVVSCSYREKAWLKTAFSIRARYPCTTATCIKPLMSIHT
jgi:hypothetical protein